MKKHWILRALKIALIVTIALNVMSFVVMSLWNWLMPPLFGLHPIGFAQALGLLILSKILFGGFRGGFGHRMYWRRHFIERWEQMTPEERDKFRAGMRGGCGHFGSSPDAPKA
jgi:hypothetical protein